MKYCENCGASLEDDSLFCEKCGTKSEPVFSSKKSNSGGIAFCSECGAKLEDGEAFCENCGTKTGIVNKIKSNKKEKKAVDGREIHICNEELWRDAVEKADGKELGLILFENNSVEHFSEFDDDDGYDYDDLNSFVEEVLEDYVLAAEKRGVYYCVYHYWLNDIESVLDELRKVVDVARPKYLFIIGGTDSFDVACWDNECGDSDDQVLSDLPYATLDTTSPWEGQKFNFSEAMRVGRLPIYEGESYFNEFKKYFENAKNNIGNFGDIVRYGLSAEVWQDTSKNVYSRISGAGNSVELSPEVTNDSVKITGDANLLYFNLHGSDSASDWYGQSGIDYPEAISPVSLEEHKTPYILGVEACYGGRYIDLEADESMILSALLKGNAIALLASSKIAYGTAEGSGSGADIVVGRFLKGVSEGESVGDAYINGLKEIYGNGSDVDDITIKTIAEFSLYGDPSARIGENKSAGLAGKLAKAFTPLAKGIKVPIPDVRRAVHSKLVEVDSKLAAPVSKYVASKYKGFEGISPKYFQMSNTGLLQASYQKDTGNFSQILKVYFDDNGKIKKEYVSKGGYKND